ncbi:MAG TPA: YceI family protein [Methylomirabilota bacterium]|nr:YceI family protein [Methylomirabilota bacterium]
MPSRPALAFLAATLLGTSIPAPATAETQRWIAEAGKSRVGFDAFHSLGDFSASSETPTADFEADIADLKQPVKGSLSVPVATLRSGKTGRDKDIQSALDAEHHPEIRYRIEKLDSSFPSLAENNDVLLAVHGVLSMHGVERPVTFAGRIRLRQGTLWVRGESFIRPREFGVPLLRHWLISIKDSVLATFDLVLSKAQ